MQTGSMATLEITFELVVGCKVLELVGVGPLADVALLVRLLHVEEELALPEEALVAEPVHQDRYFSNALSRGQVNELQAAPAK